MKKRNSIICLVITLMFCLMGAVNVKAATGLSDDEKAILAKLESGVEVNGKVIQVPASYINQAENEFMKNDVDVTAEQAAAIESKIDKAASILKSEGITSLDDLKKSGSLNDLVALAQSAAAVVDYKVSFDAANGTLAVSDVSGNDVLTTKNVINQTGFGMTETIVVGVSLVTLLAACVVIANKKKLFA